MAIHKIIPSSKDYLWGGTKLIEHYGKTTDKEIMAESWEISSHKDGPSILEDKGITLKEYTETNRETVMGSKALDFEDFPILIKFIDAKDVLSIQVHPDDEYALKHENQYGKNEMWYVLEAEPGATLYYGVKEDISKEAFRQSIEEDRILDVLNKVEVKPGDVIYVSAGTIHAIGKGIVLCEIQQNSNVTYRVYDFKRQQSDGSYRDLHIDQAVEVSNLNKVTTDFKAQGVLESYEGHTLQVLVKSPYFVTTHYAVNNKASFNVSDESFVSVICLEGTLQFNDLTLTKGESAFIDAGTGDISVVGLGKFLHVTL